MYILGLDTTQAACSAAIFDTENQKLCARTYEKMPRGHAESLPGIINRTLITAGLKFSQIGKLATTIGPGTFTGVRVGLSAARGFALALDLPLVGINSLEAIACGVDEFNNKRILAAFDARRDEIYTQLFENGSALCEPQLLSVGDAANLGGRTPTFIVGTANQLLIDSNSFLEIADARQLPDAGIVAQIAEKKIPQETSLQPLYLRKADAKSQTPLLITQPHEITIQVAGSEFAQILAQIHKQGFSNSWSGKSIASTLSSPGVRCLMAVEKSPSNQPLGFIIVREVAGECEILTLAVKLDARRRKVAQQLLSETKQNAKTVLCKKIFLEVSEENFAAKALYANAKFRKTSVRKNYYTGNDGQHHDGVVMECVL